MQADEHATGDSKAKAKELALQHFIEQLGGRVIAALRSCGVGIGAEKTAEGAEGAPLLTSPQTVEKEDTQTEAEETEEESEDSRGEAAQRKPKHRHHRGRHGAKVHPGHGDAGAHAGKGKEAGGAKRCCGGMSKEKKAKDAKDAKEAASKVEMPIDEAIREVVEQTFEEVPAAGEGLSPQDFDLVIRTFNRWDRLAISFLGRD